MGIRLHLTKVNFIAPPDKIACVAFLFSAAVTAAFMAMPFLVFNQLNRGAFISGIFAGLQAVGYTVAALASSNYVARAKNGLVWGLFGVSGFMILIGAMPFSGSVWVAGGLFAGAFTMSAFAWPSFHSWVGAEHDPHKRARYMGRINVGWSVGGAAGPFLAGPLYEADYRFPFIFVIAVCLLALYLIWTIPHESDYFGLGAPEVLHARAAHDRASESFLLCAWTATLAAHISISATRSVFPKRLDDIVAAGNLRLFFESEAPAWLNAAAATRFSWLVVALGLTMGTTFFLLGKSGWWHHKFSILAAVQALTGLSMWTLGYTHSLVIMMVAFSVIGANLGVAFFSSVYYGTANPALKHGRAAINEGVVGVGGMIGGFGFALLGARLGLETPFHWMPGLMAAIIVLQFLLIRRQRVHTPPLVIQVTDGISMTAPSECSET